MRLWQKRYLLRLIYDWLFEILSILILKVLYMLCFTTGWYSILLFFFYFKFLWWVKTILFLLNQKPLGKNLLDLIIDVFPSPKSISKEKVEHLISNKVKPFKMLPKETQILKDNFLECSSGDSKPVIVFISKMFAVEKDCISKK